MENVTNKIFMATCYKCKHFQRELLISFSIKSQKFESKKVSVLSFRFRVFKCKLFIEIYCNTQAKFEVQTFYYTVHSGEEANYAVCIIYR